MEDRKLETLLQVSCIGCRKLYRVEDLLAFSPVCPVCAAKVIGHATA